MSESDLHIIFRVACILERGLHMLGGLRTQPPLNSNFRIFRVPPGDT